MHKIISKTANGQVFKCSKCKKIHVEYKNLNFNFTDQEYQKFAQYICDIDGKEWETCNRNTIFKRKILIPVGSGYFYAIFNNEELNEFKRLLIPQRKKSNKKTIIIRKLEFTPTLN